MDRFIRADTTFDIGEEPDTVARKCTDPFCCLVLLPFLAAFGYVVWWGTAYGDLRRLHGFPDSSRNLCGVSELVKSAPMLFFCQDTQGHLSVKNSVCVKECPDIHVQDRRRLGGERDAGENSTGKANKNVTGTLTKLHSKEKSNASAAEPTGAPAACNHGHLPEHPDCCLYHTVPFGGMLCVPKDRHELQRLIQEWESPTVEWVLGLGEVVHSWEPLAISGGLALLLGFAYLFLIQGAAYCILWGLLLLLVGVLGAAGTYLVGAPFGYGLESIPTSGDNVADLVMGGFCLTGALCLMVMACCICEYLNQALMAIEEACECIRDRPSLLMEPLLAMPLRTVLIVALGWGFLMLASCLSEQEDGGGEPIDFVGGYGAKEIGFLVFYALFSWYIVEIYDAVWYFAIAYIVQQWFFRSGDRGGGTTCSIFQAIFSCLFYHMGTMALGSLLIMVFRFPRELVHTQVKEIEDSGQVVPRAVSCACSCCVRCFDEVLRYMVKSAYMDVAINSDGFCKAAYVSAELMRQVTPAAVALRAASHIFQLLGVGGIAAAGAAACHLTVVHWPKYADVDSDRFVENPLVLDAVAAAAAALIAWPFVQLLTPVSAAILFCDSIDEYRHQEYERVKLAENASNVKQQRRSFLFCCSTGAGKGNAVELGGGGSARGFSGGLPPPAEYS